MCWGAWGVCVLRTAGFLDKMLGSEFCFLRFCAVGRGSRELDFHSWLVILPDPEA